MLVVLPQRPKPHPLIACARIAQVSLPAADRATRTEVPSVSQ